MVRLLDLFIWIAGIILAKGFWSTLAAVIFPPWSFVVVVYNALLQLGWLS